jgi:citrate synthase
MTDGTPKSYISTHTKDAIFVRDVSLVDELMGKVSFTQMSFFQLMGRYASAGELQVLDAVLVTLMEHGFTPSAIIARLTAMSSPEALQAAVAAGLLSVGSTFVGTTEDAAAVLDTLITAPTGVEAAARRYAEESRRERRPLPGFGHHLHKPDDPRSARLFEIAEEAQTAGPRCAAIKVLSRHVDEVYGRHLTINATGAIAALLGDIGVPREIMRGFSLLSRCAGLLGHILEEQKMPAARAIWDQTLHSVRYLGTAGVPAGEKSDT